MLNWLLDLATHYGYIIVFIGVIVETLGVPFPGETAILVGAVLAQQGRLNIVAVGVVAWTAAVMGPTISYAAFRRWGPAVMNVRVLRRIYTVDRAAAAERFFARHGIWAVFATRFIALLRIFTGPMAGMHGMSWVRFIAANIAGAAVWVVAVCGVGVLLGANLDRADHFVSTVGYAGLAVVVVVVVAFLTWHWRRALKRKVIRTTDD